jgi:hypothetical protein
MLKVTSIVSALTLALTSVSVSSLPARAGGGSAVAGGIIGFAAGAIVGSQLSKNRQRQRVYRNTGRSSGRSAEERAYWKSIQASLNQIGFNAGPVDGAPGRKTRTAIKGFQLTIPAEPTGKLTPEQTRLLFARANPQPTYTNAAPPAGYQNQPAQAFPNVTLPGNGAATTVQPASQQLTFPSPNTAGEAPAVPAPAVTPSFPALTSTANAAPAATATQPTLTFPAAQPAQSVTDLPQAAETPGFPAPTTGEAQVATAAPEQMPEPSAPLAFPAVENAAPEVAAETPASTTPPAPAAQAQIQIDENGQPFILVNGQKFLLQAAAPAAQ